MVLTNNTLRCYNLKTEVEYATKTEMCFGNFTLDCSFACTCVVWRFEDVLHFERQIKKDTSLGLRHGGAHFAREQANL